MASCEIHGTSGMDKKKLLTGRPFGGTAILWKSNLNASVTPINIPSSRISGINITIEKKHLLIFNVYMPCKPDTSHRDNFLFCLSLISSYCDSHKYDAVILRGDFNTDFSRGASTYTKFLTDFLSMEGLSIVPPSGPISYTYESKSCSECSWLDHIFVSNLLKDSA